MKPKITLTNSSSYEFSHSSPIQLHSGQAIDPWRVLLSTLHLGCGSMFCSRLNVLLFWRTTASKSADISHSIKGNSPVQLWVYVSCHSMLLSCVNVLPNYSQIVLFKLLIMILNKLAQVTIQTYAASSSLESYLARCTPCQICSIKVGEQSFLGQASILCALWLSHCKTFLKLSNPIRSTLRRVHLNARNDVLSCP